MDDLLFSIIIPTYNRANFIEKTIDSALNQSYKEFEIIVIDDGSTDNTEEFIAQNYKESVKYLKVLNGERGAARNKGAEVAKGNYVYFLDSDDLLYPNHLEEAYNFIDKNNSPTIFFQQYEFTLEDDRKKINYRPKNNIINKELIMNGNFLSCHGVFINRDFFQQNKFNEDRNLAGSEDYELWLRIASKENIYFNPKVTSTLVYHDDRSVLNYSSDKLIKRKLLFLETLKNNSLVYKFYKSNWNQLSSDAYSYISLHIALTKKDKLIAWKYYLYALILYPKTLTSKRSFAIIKHLIF
ncbi:glycosyltransferase [Flammeovirga pectinis]|uniref:Glycosyltransferase n=1 Tax=Flammeovirga pectinis TaxID=2494373 RepID=A0A3Q9FKP1_9BACT|nr:glycosyltransferase family 2 protein [Flammeovirga pectinis]AZQ61921.1 glycosyltransferase [Flammeovirga pectinis]